MPYNTYNTIPPPPYGGIQPPNQVVVNNGFTIGPQTYVKPRAIKRVYAQMTTKNRSFLDMHHYLKSMGIKNNSFMLTLIDPDLDGIDPYDPSLNAFYKQKILVECMRNYWYFIREVVRIPTAGGAPMMYKLTRGNLALNFCMCLNFNVFYEIPRQQGKTVSAIIRYLYIYNFGTTNSKMAFLHKGMDGAKDNLQTLKNLRDELPEYLRLQERMNPDGKIDRGKNNTTEMLNPFNNNNIKVYASATNKARAASLLRGKTISQLWYDEYGFMPYNGVVFMNSAPALKTAFSIAKQNGAPYGILITTTPGFLKTDEGKEAFETKEHATKFSETWYDKTYAQLLDIVKTNNKSDFIYIRYTYQQLGCSEEWFNDVCKLLKFSWPDIRREILLEWSSGVDNSPFNREDLDTLAGLIRQPISEVYLLDKYRFETYLQADTRTYPPIIGVDVAAGYKHDSSCITVIDSQSTKVLGCLNCNYITVLDLARCIDFIVKNWLPNAVINVERNGGFGSSVIAKLLKMGLKKNLYYEIKDITVEERQDGIHAYKQKIRTKVYGLNSTKDVRKTLIDLLIDRVENHKDKIISPIIYNEILGMEVKRNGKVEHSDDTHDDQIFSWLMALYVWYEGMNLAERYGIRKSSIKTDDEIDEPVDYYNDETVEIVNSFNTKTEIEEDIEEDLEAMKKAMGVTLDEFIEKRDKEEKEMMMRLINSPIGEKAYRMKYGIPKEKPLSDYFGAGYNNYGVPDKVFTNFYKDPMMVNDNLDNPAVYAVPANQVGLLEDDDYRYIDHFNF